MTDGVYPLHGILYRKPLLKNTNKKTRRMGRVSIFYKSKNYILETLLACNPFGPSVTSN
jgi:hypothetical protein